MVAEELLIFGHLAGLGVDDRGVVPHVVLFLDNVDDREDGSDDGNPAQPFAGLVKRQVVSR